MTLPTDLGSIAAIQERRAAVEQQAQNPHLTWGELLELAAEFGRLSEEEDYLTERGEKTDV